MQLGELLSQLGSTHHRGRIRIMLELGRRSSTEPELAQLLRRMAEKGPYLRSMALFAAQSAADAEAIARAAAGDASQTLQRMALRCAARICSDAQLCQLLEQLADKLRRKLLVHLQRERRQALVDQWLGQQLQPDLELIAYAGCELLEKHRNRLQERGSGVDWARLARRQPEWAAVHALEASLEGLQAALSELARLRHKAALNLWQRAHEAELPAPEAELFASDPEAATRWGLNFDRQPQWPFASQARRLPLDLLQQLLERGWLEPGYLWWKLRPLAERSLLWDQIRERVINAWGGISPLWLQHLPAERRQAEALQQSRLATHELDPSQYLSMLEFEEAQAALRPLMQSPDVDERAVGMAALTRLGRYQPERRGEILQLLIARANEADPVRAAFLNELANLPPKAWHKEHFRPLGEILKALMAAADGSPYSYQGAERLILRILPFQPAWSAAWLGKLLRHWGGPSSGHWKIYLEAAGSAEALEDELDALVGEWLPGERFEAIWQVLRAVGRQLSGLPKLTARCVAICHHPQAEPARTAMHILLSQTRAVAYRHIPELIGQDPSWIEVAGVRDFLHRQRQDLLDPFLGGQTMQGKFASGQTEWVLHFRAGFWSWTPDQQARYAQQLGAILDQQNRDFPALRRCLRQLGRLPAVPPQILEKHAALSETRQAVRDEALRCLARVDGGQGVEFLLNALDDERARIAIYALRRALMEMAPATAAEKLTAIVSSRVTVQKEVARLLGDLPRAQGLPYLLERLQTPQHRDVRIATLRGLWPHLDHDEVWPPLEEAARSEDPALGQALAAIPEGRHGAAARARLGQLLLTLLSHPSPKVRLAVLTRFCKQPPGQQAAEILQAAAARLESEREGPPAAAVLFQSLKSDPAAWSELLRAQLPHRAALKRLVEAMQYRLRRKESERELFQASLTVLQEDPATQLLWLNLLASSRPVEELLTALEQEVLSDPSAWDIPLHWPHLLRLQSYRLDRGGYLRIWERWGQQVDPRLRRLCLEALVIHSEAFGWSEDNRGHLKHFQNDSAALVRGRADFIFPPPV